MGSTFASLRPTGIRRPEINPPYQLYQLKYLLILNHGLSPDTSSKVAFQPPGFFDSNSNRTSDARSARTLE